MLVVGDCGWPEKQGGSEDRNRKGDGKESGGGHDGHEERLFTNLHRMKERVDDVIDLLVIETHAVD